ncbi:MAG: minor capsid protein [Candidatus Faecalibacterium intestinavium]|uniref:Minor capsid protein n=1 Tax=Candidatus Faecalibacterium intestinavium TaxID=2838580 RepID=A0A9E2NQ93_9FIRM|nr:minor capsid protein [Candidatus Faecalibacterium intestinavium]
MKNADYWRGRFAVLESSAHRTADGRLQKLEEIYRGAEQSVAREIESWYQRFAANNQITLAEARKRLTTGQLEEFRWTAEQYVKAAQKAGLSEEWIKKLENASARFHVSRLESLQLQIQQQAELLFGNQLDEVDGLLREITADGRARTAYEIQKGLGLGWDIAAPDQAKLDTLLKTPWTTDGRTFRDRCWTDKAALVDAVQREMIQGMLRGDPPAKAVEAIRKQFGVARAKTARLVHTETTYFTALSRAQTYRELGVEQIEIVETLDSRTCPVCGALDGKVISRAEYQPGVTVPPFHPNCRGTTCPHYDDMDGERAARKAEGEVYYLPAGTTYQQWKKAFAEGGSKEGLTPARARNYDSPLAGALGRDHYDQLRDRVDRCQTPALQKVWDRYEGEISVGSTRHTGGAYCHQNEIYINLEADAAGRTWRAAYATTFHESGHALDTIAAGFGSSNGLPFYSSTYKDGLFPRTIRQEVDDWVQAILADMKAHKTDFSYWVQQGWITPAAAGQYAAQAGLKITKSMAYGAVEKQVRELDLLHRADLSDILEGATRGKIRCGFGHGVSYWTRRTYNGVNCGLGTEAFAEMTSAALACPESLEALKTYLPKSYALYEEMLAALIPSP